MLHIVNVEVLLNFVLDIVTVTDQVNNANVVGTCQSWNILHSDPWLELTVKMTHILNQTSLPRYVGLSQCRVYTGFATLTHTSRVDIQGLQH